MQYIGAFEAKTHFSSLLTQVEKGEEILITKHGHPVAKLVPVSAINQESLHLTIEKLKKFASDNTLGDLDWKALRDEGRK